MPESKPINCKPYVSSTTHFQFDGTNENWSFAGVNAKKNFGDNLSLTLSAGTGFKTKQDAGQKDAFTSFAHEAKLKGDLSLSDDLSLIAYYRLRYDNDWQQRFVFGANYSSNDKFSVYTQAHVTKKSDVKTGGWIGVSYNYSPNLTLL